MPAEAPYDVKVSGAYSRINPELDSSYNFLLEKIIHKTRLGKVKNFLIDRPVNALFSRDDEKPNPVFDSESNYLEPELVKNKI